MSSYVIWIDSKEAKVFNLTSKSEDPKHVKTHGAKHPTESHGRHSGSHHPESEHLFKDLSATLTDATEILLIGPGEAKVNFKNYLEKHHATTIAKKVAGVETVDHPTDPQIKALAGKFFKSYHLFH